MERPQVAYANNMQAAHAIDDYAKVADRASYPLTIRPYNHHSPESTPWWFIPSNDWPAYDLNKLFIRRTFEPNLEGQYMFVGYYIEKGVGASTQAQRKFIMTPKWHWHKFLDLTINGKTEAVIRDVLNISGCPVRIEIDMYEYNRIREPDNNHAPYDQVAYAISTEDMVLDVVQSANNELSFLNMCSDLQVMGSQFTENASLLEFFWVDLRIGIGLNYFSDSGVSWTASDLWKKALKPWLVLI